MAEARSIGRLGDGGEGFDQASLKWLGRALSAGPSKLSPLVTIAP